MSMSAAPTDSATSSRTCADVGADVSTYSKARARRCRTPHRTAGRSSATPWASHRPPPARRPIGGLPRIVVGVHAHVPGMSPSGSLPAVTGDAAPWAPAVIAE